MGFYLLVLVFFFYLFLCWFIADEEAKVWRDKLKFKRKSKPKVKDKDTAKPKPQRKDKPKNRPRATRIFPLVKEQKPLSKNDHLSSQAENSIVNRKNTDKNESPRNINFIPDTRKGTEKQRSSSERINKDTSDIIPSNRGSIKEASSSNNNKPYQPKRKIDWEELQVRRAAIGAKGELFVLKLEKQNLSEINSPHLNSIEHVSKTQGDYLGYDIKSFDEEGNPKYIEVKSTTLDFDQAFFMTQNELDAMESYGNQYYLYRVYNLNVSKKRPDMKVFRGSDEIREKFKFEISKYMLNLKG